MPEQYAVVREQYGKDPFFFPLIGAVLSRAQDGIVYTDDPRRPSQIYIEHGFGFAQIFGKSISAFERALDRYFMVDRRFFAPKVRLYAPLPPLFLSNPRYEPLRSIRQRFFLSVKAPSLSAPTESSVSCVDVNESNVDRVEEAFGVTSRFWRNAEDFARHSLGVLAFFQGEPAALCYAAAVADERAEIDVLTLPQFRQRGFGTLVSRRFIERCRQAGVSPMWDCFTNNATSMALCNSLGFGASLPPYSLFTIPGV